MPPPNIDLIRVSKTVTHPGAFLSVVREPNSERVWVGHADSKIYAIDFAAERPVATAVFEGHTSYVSSLGLVGNTLVSAGWDHKLMWWDLPNRRLVRAVEAHDRWIRQLVVNRARTVIATISDDMTCNLWDAQSGRLMRTLSGFDARVPTYDFPNKIFACAFSPDGRHVAAADATCRVIVWATESGHEEARFEVPNFLTISRGGNLPSCGIRRMAFSPDGNSLTLAGKETSNEAYVISGKGLVQTFTWRTGEKTNEHKLRDNTQFEALYCHPQSAWILVAPFHPANGALYFLDPTQARVLKETPATMQTYDLTVNETANAIYTVGVGKALKWEIPA